MNKLNNFDELMKKLNDGIVLVYAGIDACSICHVDKPLVEEIVTKNNISAYEIDSISMNQARGFFSLFTAPVVMLFYNGKEIHRQARIIDFKELDYRINQLKDALS